MRRLILALLLPVALAAGASRPALSQPASGPLLLPPITRALDQQLGTIRTENANDPDQAIARLTALLLQAERGRQAGEQIVILTARSQQEIRAKRIDRAIEDLNRAIAISGAYPLPFFLRGSYEALRGDRSKALADLDKAIEVEPKFLPAYRARARMLSDLRRWGDAAADHSRVLAERPDDAEARYNRALAHSLAGNKQAALVDIDMVMVRNPHDPAMLIEKSIILRGMGNFDAALAALERAMADGDDRGIALRERGMVHFARGDFAAAERDLKRAYDLGLGTGLPAPYVAVYLEAARLRLGQSDRADLARRQELAFTKGWANTVAEFLGDRIAAEALVARTKEDVKAEREADERLCEAQFFIAQRHMADGRIDAAIGAFQAVVATGVTWFNEYDLARGELRRLGRL
ncbi:tetratricopeptide repeat protein [Desertibaculum subflavum]|uniref:tetratricopeptide repeat protein n=1 Tax=Desertibaculum subflavum TaxID=2268458 RepID=UPI000E660155